jgi:hypothetical protein
VRSFGPFRDRPDEPPLCARERHRRFVFVHPLPDAVGRGVGDCVAASGVRRCGAACALPASARRCRPASADSPSSSRCPPSARRSSASHPAASTAAGGHRSNAGGADRGEGLRGDRADRWRSRLELRKENRG